MPPGKDTTMLPTAQLMIPNFMHANDDSGHIAQRKRTHLALPVSCCCAAQTCILPFQCTAHPTKQPLSGHPSCCCRCQWCRCCHSPASTAKYVCSGTLVCWPQSQQTPAQQTSLSATTSCTAATRRCTDPSWIPGAAVAGCSSRQPPFHLLATASSAVT